MRLTTNVPLTYVEDERPFLLEHDRHLVLTWGEPLEAGLEETAERFLERTVDYWRRWVKGTRVPRDYQREVVRSALALKLHQYEDTGALLAATTTSLPEHPGSGRTWDYRFCWLRDAYFTLNALERLGHSEEMERFLEYLRNLCEERGGVLQPAYRINGDSQAPESGCSSTSPGSTATGRCGSATRRSSTCRTTSTARWCSRSAASSSTRASSARCRRTPRSR